MVPAHRLLSFASPTTSTRMSRLHIGLCVLPFLAACGGSQFAYLDEGGGLSLSVVREQNYLGGSWKSTLISAASPRCQKRHPLDGLAADSFQLKVFRPEPGTYVLNAGTRWYVTELRNCEFQAYKSPPPFPGDAIGRFEVRDDKLQFVAEKPVKR